MPTATLIRAGLVAPDTDLSKVPSLAVADCTMLTIGLTCSAPNQSAVVEVVYTDGVGNILGDVQIAVASNSTADWGALFIGRANDGNEPVLHCAGVQAFIGLIGWAPTGTTPPAWNLAARVR